MAEDEDEKILRALRELCEMYGRKMSEGALARWVSIWAPYDYDRLEKAIQKVAVSSSYMPTIHQLRQAVSHLYPTKAAQRVMLRWKGLGRSGVPSQDEIDVILESIGEPKGSVSRQHLVPGA